MSFGIFFEARFENDFCSISDPPDPQKTYENLKFFKDFAFSAKSLWKSILGRFLLHFRTPDPMKIGPRRCPNAIRKKIQKSIAFGRLRGRFCIDFGTQLGSGGGSANAVLDVFCGLGAVLGGRWPQDAPRALPRPILDRFWSIFVEFLMLLPLFLLALKRELGIEVGLLFRCRGYWCVLPSCVISLTIHSQNPFIEARWRRWPEGQLDKEYNILYKIYYI